MDGYYRHTGRTRSLGGYEALLGNSQSQSQAPPATAGMPIHYDQGLGITGKIGRRKIYTLPPKESEGEAVEGVEKKAGEAKVVDFGDLSKVQYYGGTLTPAHQFTSDLGKLPNETTGMEIITFYKDANVSSVRFSFGFRVETDSELIRFDMNGELGMHSLFML